MEKLIRKITNIVIMALTAFVIITGMTVVFTGNESVLDVSLFVTYIMAFIAVILILVFAILQIASYPKQLVRALILLAVNAAIFLLCYLITPDTMSNVAQQLGLTLTVYKFVYAAVYYTGIVLAGVIVALIGSIVYVKVKN
ncbi:MAG: hypothetical protein LBL13_00820 [Bacteroidales bacterium]|nr:hypothetical protein [Bacteroidales bacterium]